MTDDRVCVRWKVESAGLPASFHRSFSPRCTYHSCSRPAQRCWFGHLTNLPEAEQKEKTRLLGYPIRMYHIRVRKPTICVPNLWDSVVTFYFIFKEEKMKRKKPRRSSRPGWLLWENDLRDDCFAPISPLESCWMIIGESL